MITWKNKNRKNLTGISPWQKIFIKKVITAKPGKILPGPAK